MSKVMNAIDAHRAHQAGGANHAGRRTRQNRSHRLRCAPASVADRAAVGLHHAQARAVRGRVSRFFRCDDHPRRDVGVDHGGREPFVFAILGENSMRDRERTAERGERARDRLLGFRGSRSECSRQTANASGAAARCEPADSRELRRGSAHVHGCRRTRCARHAESHRARRPAARDATARARRVRRDSGGRFRSGPRSRRW